MMNLLKLLFCAVFFTLTTAYANSIENSKFQFGIGNSSLSPNVNVDCNDHGIESISIPINTSAYTPIKPTENTAQITCYFSHQEQSLGEITLQLTIDPISHNVTHADIIENTLNQASIEIIQTNQELFVYFSENESTV